MIQNKYQLAFHPNSDIFIEFTTGVTLSDSGEFTTGVLHDKWVLVQWCRDPDRREQFDVIGWFDGHDIPRSFDINRNSIYTVEVAREIWNAMVQYHGMKQKDAA
jgi:hypothetical protein